MTIPRLSSAAIPLKQLAHGLALGTGGALLAGANVTLAVGAGRTMDPNHKVESEQEQAHADVYAAGAALFTARRLLARESLPLALRVGTTFPAAIAVGMGASWLYQKSGPTVREIMAVVKELV